MRPSSIVDNIPSIVIMEGTLQFPDGNEQAKFNIKRWLKLNILSFQWGMGWGCVDDKFSNSNDFWTNDSQDIWSEMASLDHSEILTAKFTWRNSFGL